MCTVIISVPESPESPIRLLAVRDEDPERPSRRVGPWWDDQPGVIGVKDLLAGGAWLAADSTNRTMAVMINRMGTPDVAVPTSRGTLVLDSLAGRALPETPTTFGFNLLEIRDGTATVTTWDGDQITRQRLTPGIHMIAHGEVDDPSTPRVAAWLPAFTQTDSLSETWWDEWLAVLHHTTHMPPTDDRAIIRDNRPYGIPTLSLMLCLLSVGPYDLEIRDAVLPQPGRWSSELEWEQHSSGM